MRRRISRRRDKNVSSKRAVDCVRRQTSWTSKPPDLRRVYLSKSSPLKDGGISVVWVYGSPQVSRGFAPAVAIQY